MKNICGIYKITSPSGKVYIGQGKNIYKRYLSYKNGHSKNQIKLHNSIQKHGFDSHVFEVIEECNFEQLNIRERYWQDFYNVLNDRGLNCVLTYTDEVKGVISEETREKFKKRMKGEGNPMFGKPHSEATKEKIREAVKDRKGTPHTEEHKQKLSKERAGENHPMYGKKHTEEAKKQMSSSRKGMKFSEEHKKKLSEANKKAERVHPTAKLVLCLETGIFYESIGEASKASGMSKTTLRSYLNGVVKTKTINYIYV